nr:hypothetical protein [Pseudomonas sp. TH49]
MLKHTYCRALQAIRAKITVHAKNESSSATFLHQISPHKSGGVYKTILFVGMTVGISLLLSFISIVHAAGGPYVVDDGAINAPGECNIDFAYKSQRHHQSTYQAELAQDCTFKELPSLQFGAAVLHSHDEGKRLDIVNPKIKVQVFSVNELEVAVVAGASFALDRGHSFDAAELALPMTYQPFETFRLNLSSGWAHEYNDGKQRHSWNWGTGVEYAPVEYLTLIAERFGQEGGDHGWQAGPRLHLGKQVDIDLVAGRHLNNGRDQWLASSITWRF